MLTVFESLFADYVNPKECSQMLKQADLDNNGTIEFHEFEKVMNIQRETGGEGGWIKLKLFESIGG